MKLIRHASSLEQGCDILCSDVSLRCGRKSATPPENCRERVEESISWGAAGRLSHPRRIVGREWRRASLGVRQEDCHTPLARFEYD